MLSYCSNAYPRRLHGHARTVKEPVDSKRTTPERRASSRGRPSSSWAPSCSDSCSDRLLPLRFAVPGQRSALWMVGVSLILIGLGLFAAGIAQLLPRGDAGPHEPADPLAGDDRHPWLDPQSDLPRHVPHLRRHRPRRAQPGILIVMLPLAITIRYGVVAREEAYLEAALRRCVPRLQGPRAPLALAATDAVTPRASALGGMRDGAPAVIGAPGPALLLRGNPDDGGGQRAVRRSGNTSSWAWAVGIALSGPTWSCRSRRPR